MCACSSVCCALQASLLEYAKQLAEAAADGAPITDCVLAVPASYTPQQVGWLPLPLLLALASTQLCCGMPACLPRRL